jgi:hypothetical protein
MKKQKYLPLYYEWHKRGYAEFLCNYFKDHHTRGYSEHPLFELFLPTEEEKAQHVKDGFSGYAWGGREIEIGIPFTDLRQNVILLMAAMNGEKL